MVAHEDVGVTAMINLNLDGFKKSIQLRRKDATKSFHRSWSWAKTTLFLAESFTLPLVQWAATGEKPRPIESLRLVRWIFQEAQKLIEQDLQNIQDGVYPAEVLYEVHPLAHVKRMPRILFDTIRFARQKKSQKHAVFSEDAQEFLRDLPDYYRRNFHFQNQGYLSETSAEIYEHQVEILFAGLADAMRRLLLPALKRTIGGTQGEGLRFLEIGAGRGSLSRYVRHVYPKAQIVLLDLSPHYLRAAKQDFVNDLRMDFIQGDAAQLPFEAGQFDAIYSCFMFHEVPLKVRSQILRESKRVLKPGGFHGFVDSLQKGDRPEVDTALKKFPLDFHEPFYQNYILNKMEGLLISEGFDDIDTQFGFLSKMVSSKKPV